jgi:hypothetical protein
MSVFHPASHASPARSQARTTGWLATIRRFLADFRAIAFSTYRPEQHYMRGPGPACAAKRDKSISAKSENRLSDRIILKEKRNG